jgi:hypothetical protein
MSYRQRLAEKLGFEQWDNEILARNALEEIERLRAALGQVRAERCACKCDDDGDFASQCLAHKEVENERDALRAALRPFADAGRWAAEVCVQDVLLRCRRKSGLVTLAELPLQHFARAAELVPAEST